MKEYLQETISFWENRAGLSFSIPSTLFQRKGLLILQKERMLQGRLASDPSIGILW